MKKLIAVFVMSCLAVTAAMADDDDDDDNDFGPAGIMSSRNKEELPPITLSSGKALAEAPLKLKSGKYYEIEITSDGSQELALAGPEFFRAVWVDEIVINGLEIRPLGVDSVEFDEAGTMEVSFIAIKPGAYYLKVPQSRGDSQRLDITIE